LGVNPGDLIIIGARPSVGKTAFALNIANKVSSYEGHNVLFFSLEMTTQQLVQRIISIETIIPITSLRTARLKKDE
jgi:replicative DNA helicase